MCLVVGASPKAVQALLVLHRLLVSLRAFYLAYVQVLPKKQHRATGKGAGQTCHIERFNNTLRQRLGRFVRKAPSFSKTDAMHENCLRLFFHDYNKQCRKT